MSNGITATPAGGATAPPRLALFASISLLIHVWALAGLAPAGPGTVAETQTLRITLSPAAGDDPAVAPSPARSGTATPVADRGDRHRKPASTGAAATTTEPLPRPRNTAAASAASRLRTAAPTPAGGTTPAARSDGAAAMGRPRRETPAAGTEAARAPTPARSEVAVPVADRGDLDRKPAPAGAAATATRPRPRSGDTAAASIANPGRAAAPTPAGDTTPPAPSAPRLRASLLTLLRDRLRYPPLARRRGWEGTVWVEVRIDGDGRLDAVALERGSGRRILDRAALDAVRSLRGVVVASAGTPRRLRLPIVYRLLDGSPRG